jgi:hypothetical protein
MLGDTGIDAVAKEAHPVHPRGRPIIISRNTGFGVSRKFPRRILLIIKIVVHGRSDAHTVRIIDLTLGTDKDFAVSIHVTTLPRSTDRMGFQTRWRQ